MKDVVVCDKPRGADKQALIRGCPNGETPPAMLENPHCVEVPKFKIQITNKSKISNSNNQTFEN